MAIWCGSRSFVVIVGGVVMVGGGAASIGIGPLGGVGHASVGWLVAMRGGGGGFWNVVLQIWFVGCSLVGLGLRAFFVGGGWGVGEPGCLGQ